VSPQPWASNIFSELIANRHIPVFNDFWESHFAPRERKLQKISGQKDDHSVEEFIEETELLLKSSPTQDEEKVDFIISHLEGPASELIANRHIPVFNDFWVFLCILSNLFKSCE
jgi:hypothetical protein